MNAQCCKLVLHAECHFAECHYAECHFAECHCAECCGAVTPWLNVYLDSQISDEAK